MLCNDNEHDINYQSNKNISKSHKYVYQPENLTSEHESSQPLFR